MKPIKTIYKIGPGPSSSHTIAPKNACERYLKQYPNIDSVIVELYGSLSLTGKGHYTDEIIKKVFNDIKCEILFKLDWEYEFTSGLIIYGYKDNKLIDKWVVYSLGGGDYKVLNQDNPELEEIYTLTTFNTIKTYIEDNNISLLDFIVKHEPNILNDMSTVLDQMIETINNGLTSEGLLKGTLNIKRASKQLYKHASKDNDDRLKLMSYANASNEENACCKTVVTAPTLGSCGVVSSVCYHLLKDLNYDYHKICEGLAIAGLFGALVRENATISGAIGGCQAEVGVACAMGSALISYVNDANIQIIEHAAEMGIEHHLGLTCDPIGGYVIIPCIERNAVASVRCFDNYLFASKMNIIKNNKVSFDTVVRTMNFTGEKIVNELKETSLGGLAKEYYE